LVFTGNGSVCGLDSDSDGYPDVGLDCTEEQCEMVSTMYSSDGM